MVDDYMDALRSGYCSSVRFSPNVRFLFLLMDSPIEGKPKVVEFLVGVSEGVKYVSVRQHIIDVSTACILIK